MKRYKEEVDALHASDALRERIAALPQQRRPKRFRPRHGIAIAAVLVVVLLGSAVMAPLLNGSVKSSSLEQAIEYGADDAFSARTDAPNETAFTSDTSKAVGTLPQNRKLIRNAELYVETKTYDAFRTALLRSTESLNGYIESTDADYAYNGTRTETLVLRIPSEHLDSFLESVSELGTVTSQNSSIQDVTDEYIDAESRLAALETEQQTLLDLLKKADSLADTLEIQDRLSDVRGELESYKGRLKALDGQIAYSTVRLNLSEVEHITPAESKSFGTQLRQNLSDNCYSIARSARGFALWFLSSLPYFAIILVFAAIAALIVVKVRRRRSK